MRERFEIYCRMRAIKVFAGIACEVLHCGARHIFLIMICLRPTLTPCAPRLTHDWHPFTTLILSIQRTPHFFANLSL
jgi:hypothetical protein